MHTLYDTFALPYTFHLRFFAPVTTAFINEYDGPKELKQRWVPLKKISPYLRQAVVLAEDDRFYEHSGYDWEAIKKAAQVDWKKKRFARGASTITQQLAKNLYLSSAKNPLRKIKEFFIALKLERELSKDRILEIYLNVIEWGNGIYGAEAAAKHYFNTSAVSLDKYQAAFLSAIISKPRFYDKYRGGPYLQRRIANIEGRL
jgi:monofunctional biosynthetic peptidoglycan transglycosylase